MQFIWLFVLSFINAAPVEAQTPKALKSGERFPNSAKAVIVEHKAAYAPKPERGPHIDVKVTPPEIRGKDGRVMIEVYNRGKDHIASVHFDVTLFNQGGYQFSAEITAQDLKPNMSGGQWVKIPPLKDKFPKIIGAKLEHMRIIDINAQEVSMKIYMDLIKY